MARLSNKVLPEFDAFTGPFDMQKQDRAMDEIMKKYDVISFSVADGRAYYVVLSKSPLVLVHVPFLDGYQIPDAHVRGLRLSDVEEKIAYEKRIAELFAKSDF